MSFDILKLYILTEKRFLTVLKFSRLFNNFNNIFINFLDYLFILKMYLKRNINHLHSAKFFRSILILKTETINVTK